MIEVGPVDIGRKVIYRAGHGNAEDGVITSYNDSVIFVRYGNDVHGKGTRREDLEWL